jgi:hypothetical protein
VAYTMQRVIDDARVPLNDPAPGVRYPDADLLKIANAAVLILRRRRPDLFFGRFTALPGEMTAGQNLPLDDEYFPAVVDYVVARAETRDDEEALKTRAAMFFQLFEGALGG